MHPLSIPFAHLISIPAGVVYRQGAPFSRSIHLHSLAAPRLHAPRLHAPRLTHTYTHTGIPRFLASRNRSEEALANLACLRRLPPTDDSVIHELAEIESAIAEEREARAGLYWKEAFFGKGNFVR
ncbi:Sugar transporter [Mycena venus]|uniref:Sugar transporter n=1 Tax=Mycena venus TaxID=2733690 RepID=A0A8H6YC72_9AGAR|nr:Sugar transporter [Mycena venus]